MNVFELLFFLLVCIAVAFICPSGFPIGLRIRANLIELNFDFGIAAGGGSVHGRDDFGDMALNRLHRPCPNTTTAIFRLARFCW